MKIEIWGENKPTLRGFDQKGNYKQWKTAHFGGRAVVETIVEAQKVMKDMFNKGWDVKIKITE